MTFGAPTGPRVSSYRDLLVWQRAIELVEVIYRFTRRFPSAERFGLVSQLRRAAVSIPSNIAEGHGRKYLGDYVRHLSVANGSLMELETQVVIAARMGYLEADVQQEALNLSGEVGRMLAGLIRALRSRPRAPPTPDP